VQPEQKQYNATFLDVFDTVTTVVGKAESEEVFREQAQQVHEILQVYHQLFDIYNDYEGINNLKTVNDNAGIAPVKVDEPILTLLKHCKSYYEMTDGMVNPAMGSVLQLWHVARNDGVNDPAHAYLPKEEKLREAAKYMDFDTVIIDDALDTVYISDPNVRLDVGAVAKGWATQRVAENAPEGLLISVGGNVCPTGPKDENGTPWVVGITDPNGGDYLHTIYTTRSSVVTSGDYQRTYMVEGELYHHIIDPVTLYPSAYWRSVTIVCDDSGLSDALSTALFLLPLEEGKALLANCGAEAMWVDGEGQEFFSAGFEALIRT
jgi:thiamine biosynthesis lipoprotein